MIQMRTRGLALDDLFAMNRWISENFTDLVEERSTYLEDDLWVAVIWLLDDTPVSQLLLFKLAFG